jgi:hypothetical protein
VSVVLHSAGSFRQFTHSPAESRRTSGPLLPDSSMIALISAAYHLVGSGYDVQPHLQAKCDLTITWAQVSIMQEIMQLRTKHG